MNALALFALVLSASAEIAAPSVANVRASCETAKDVGRVKCAVVLEKANAVWADVSVRDLPDTVSALRGRVSLGDAESNEPLRTSWSLALVSKKPVAGEVRFRVRWVTCDTHGRCTPNELEAVAALSVAQ